MKNKILGTNFLLLTGLIFLSAFVRLFPHPPNFAPITAMALLSGAYFTDKKLAFIIPIIALFITDLIIGLYSGMWVVYICFVLIVLIGLSLKNNFKISRLAITTFSSSILFFIITNFGVWAFGVLYQKNLAGLIQCYTLAIPFFQNSVLGDLIYSFALFGLYHLISNTIKQKATVLSNIKN